MLTPHRPSHRRPWWRPRSKRALPGVLSAAELDSAFRQERARVDRNGRCFSVVVFTVDGRQDEAMAGLARVLVERMRAYDTLGEFDDDRLALLLPESDGPGAWNCADGALEQLAASGLEVECQVYTYPLERGGRDGRGLRDEAGAGGAPGPHRLESDPPVRGTGTDGPARSAYPKAIEARTALHLSTEGVEGGPRPVRDLYPHFLEELPPWRRALDLVIASALLALLLPLFLVVAAAIKLTSRGPVLFVQWRAGRGGRPFRFFKFRSMYVDAEERRDELASENEQSGPIFKIRRDPRITPIGRLIRKASIDEMPQLWNVIVGDMTLVGPRPPTLDEVAAYETWQRERLDITGGLTCIWQVSGRSEIGFEEWVRMDLEYKRKRSPLFDVKLLWRTIGAVFTGRGAY